MSDGDGGFKSAVAEAVIKPARDEVGKVIEVAGQAVSGKTPTPQQTLQKQQEDQKKIADVQRRIQWWKNIEAQQKTVGNQKKQEEMVEKSEQKQEQKIKQFEVVQKKQSLSESVKQAQTRTEIKGHGVGG